MNLKVADGGGNKEPEEPVWDYLQVVQNHTVTQLQPQCCQHQVSGNVVIVGQRGLGEVTAERHGVQQQLLHVFGHHGRLSFVQAHVHWVRNHLSWNLALIILQKQ